MPSYLSVLEHAQQAEDEQDKEDVAEISCASEVTQHASSEAPDAFDPKQSQGTRY